MLIRPFSSAVFWNSRTTLAFRSVRSSFEEIVFRLGGQDERKGGNGTEDTKLYLAISAR